MSDSNTIEFVEQSYIYDKHSRRPNKGQSRETVKIGYAIRRKTQHHYTQTNTKKVNKTCALLQTTGGKDEQYIVFMRI
jgi:hypothetical protein